MKKQTFNKLVRDNIPEICRANGAEPETRILSEEEFVIELRKKLAEEIAEFQEESNLEELADILELVKANAETLGGTLEEVEKIRSDKALKRGGFTKRLFLISTSK